MRRLFRAQGATEYLVLLAVVLVIGLVGIALLGFFPGTASEAQFSESQIYWGSASPVAITESSARRWSATETEPYLRLRNTGSYSIRVTKLLNGNQSISQFYVNSGFDPNPGGRQLADYFYMGPGEEQYLGWKVIYPGLPQDREILFQTTASGQYALGGAAAVCSAAEAANAGFAQMNGFGFEYVEYVEGQQMTKRQVGNKPLIIKCR